MQNVHLIK